jgi:NAD(P)-dependent dehydrogenase (short-subunit alcohol dehydrogenase family)
LITGCSTGIGLGTAVAFARNGDTVLATMRNPAKAEAPHAAAEAARTQVEVMALDVTDDASANACVAGVVERHRRIDMLVNNAGIGRQSGAVEDFVEAANAVMFSDESKSV